MQRSSIIWSRVLAGAAISALALAGSAAPSGGGGEVTPFIDIVVTKTDGVTTAVAGASVTYTIVITNQGNVASDAAVNDAFSSQFSSISWTCSPAGGASCDAGGSSGTTDIVDVVSLPAGGQVTYTVQATIAASATGTLVNTATALDVNGRDTNESDNAATDIDTLVPPSDGGGSTPDVGGSTAVAGAVAVQPLLTG